MYKKAKLDRYSNHKPLQKRSQKIMMVCQTQRVVEYLNRPSYSKHHSTGVLEPGGHVVEVRRVPQTAPFQINNTIPALAHAFSYQYLFFFLPTFQLVSTPYELCSGRHVPLHATFITPSILYARNNNLCIYYKGIGERSLPESNGRRETHIDKKKKRKQISKKKINTS